MPKPWAKYEVGFIDHSKFRALNANAICLWLEGKNYCDTHLTDGLIPSHVVKQFRFAGKKSIELLTASAGPKDLSSGEQWAPLWEVHPVGFKMHDYLDHNDCRELVIARKAKAEQEKEADKARKKAARDAKAARLRAAEQAPDIQPDTARTSDRTHAGRAPDDRPDSGSMTEVRSQKSERERERAPVGASLARPSTLVQRLRGDAAWQGPRGLYVTHKQHAKFVAMRNGNEGEVNAFYADVGEEWGYGKHKHTNFDPDMFKFWDDRCRERWPVMPPAPKDSGPAYQKVS